MLHARDVLNSEVVVLDHLLVCSLHDTLSYVYTGAKLPAVCTLKSRLPAWLHEFQSRFQFAYSWKKCPVYVCMLERGCSFPPLSQGILQTAARNSLAVLTVVLRLKKKK